MRILGRRSIPKERVEIMSPPCPVCQERFRLYCDWTMAAVGNRADQHFRPHFQDGEINDYEAKREAWADSCFALIVTARAEARATKANRLAQYQSRLMKNKIVTSLPCPFCGKEIDLSHCQSYGMVGYLLDYQHSYGGGARAHCDCEPINELHKNEEWNSDNDEILKQWIEESKQVWRTTSPNCILLTDEELHAAQSRGGRHQLKRDKRRGAENQDADDKRRGGLVGMHNRWHVAKGVKATTCVLCNSTAV